MKINSLKCPNCSSSLNVDVEDTNNLKCEYCGSTLKYVPDKEELELIRAQALKAESNAKEMNAKTINDVVNNIAKPLAKSYIALRIVGLVLVVIIFAVIAGVIITQVNKQGGSSNGIDITEQKDKINDLYNEGKKESFNNTFNKGETPGAFIKDDLDDIIDYLNQGTYKVSVTYKDVVESTDVNEIKTVRNSINEFNDYDVTLKYDDKGFVNQYIIEDLS
jgi:hypothetical protein